MGFVIPDEDEVTSVGYVSTGAFSARDVAKSLTSSFEDSWSVYDEPPNRYEGYGDTFKVTVIVEKV